MTNSVPHLILEVRPALEEVDQAKSELPRPEDVLAQWLLALPPEADVESAARAQIAMIDRKDVQHPDVEVLRTLLCAMAGEQARPVRQGNL
ncbi:hypothetical protein [Aestuariivirga sp.]|uniref:hypothetical protein n=1 Tax=Aestuariivirga sp. TaxID=2650926 RepID=UPI0039E4F6B2